MNMQLTIDKAGRVVIPKKVRDHFGIGAGDSMKLTTDERGVRLEPASPVSRVRRKGDIWVHTGTGKVSAEQFNKYREDQYRLRDELNRNPRG